MFPLFTLKRGRETEGFSEMFAKFLRTKPCHILEDRIIRDKMARTFNFYYTDY
jgi:hypothetical protein